MILTFFFEWFYHCHGRRKYILYTVCSLFIVGRPSSWIQLSILSLLIVLGEPIKTHILAQWNKIGHWLFASEPIGNVFHLHAVISKIPKLCFIIKPPACWGADVSIEIYELLLLFSIISPWYFVYKQLPEVFYKKSCS